MLQFEIYRDNTNKYQWRQIGESFQVIDESGVGFARKIDCENAIFELAKCRQIVRTNGSRSFKTWRLFSLLPFYLRRVAER